MLRMFSSAVVVLVLMGLVGCAKNPAQMNLAEVEAYLQKELALKDLKLQGQPGQGYTGTAKGTDGSEYKITVTQDVKASQLSYKAESTSGDELTGSLKNQ